MTYNFDIYTDSSCDLSLEMQEKYDLKVMQLEVLIDDNPPILNRDIEPKAFYQKLRDEANAKTRAMTPGYFEEHMRKRFRSRVRHFVYWFYIRVICDILQWCNDDRRITGRI